MPQDNIRSQVRPGIRQTGTKTKTTMTKKTKTSVRSSLLHRQRRQELLIRLRS